MRLNTQLISALLLAYYSFQKPNYTGNINLFRKHWHQMLQYLELPLNFSKEAFWGAHVSFGGTELLIAPPHFELCLPQIKQVL